MSIIIMKSNGEHIKVCVRMRPLLQPYEDEVVWDVSGGKTVSSLGSAGNVDVSALSLSSLKERELRRRYVDNLGPSNFSFDYVYGPEDTSMGIYQDICNPILESVIQGYNGAIMMYGQTTSGKTYTMLGVPELPGLLPCAMRHIFHIMSSGDYNVWVSYLEIYNEQINDLLNPGAFNLKMKEDRASGIRIENLSLHQVWSFDQVIMIMNFGEEKRMYRETSLHEHSSRSHTIFRVYIENKDSSFKKTFGCLNLVDLAGSERLNEYETREANSLEETGYINKSLFALANVVNKLAEGKKQHIPYRDSKLTRVLGQALGGNSLAAIICTISPAGVNFHQTLSTLRFATRAKTVKNLPSVNEIVSDAQLVTRYKLEINKLKSELENARNAFFSVNSKNKELTQQLSESPQPQDPLELEQQRVLFEDSQAANWQSKKQLEDFELLSKRSPVAHISGEAIFIENMIMSINEELGVDIANDPDWKVTCITVKEEYSKALISLQDKSTELLSTGLKEIAIKEDIDPIDHLLSENIFSDIVPNFTQASEPSEHAILQLKQQHERYISKIETRYEQAKSALATYYQEAPGADAKAQCFSHLHSQYEQSLKLVELTFIQTLNSFDESLETPRKHMDPQGGGCGYMWGSGKDGRLGNNSESSCQVPLCVLQEIHRIECGYHHSAAITMTGGLLTWGRGLFGQLGHNSSDSFFVPKQVLSLSDSRVLQVACGWQHTMVLTSENKVLTWGCGEDGQLGHGDFKDYSGPKEVKTLMGVGAALISCGHSHSGCLTGDSVYMWGCNPDCRCFVQKSGNIGAPLKVTFSDVPVHLSLGVNHSGVVGDSGKVHLAGTGAEGAPSKELDAVKVACGDSFTLILDRRGKVLGFGKSEHGRLGLGEELPEQVEEPKELALEGIVGISAGCRHAGAVNSRGELFLWGFNHYQQLGVGNNKDVYRPVKALNGVYDVSCGYFHSGAVLER